MDTLNIGNKKDFCKLKVGDWVTQYSKGYWQIIEIKEKYAEEDYLYSNGCVQKKGEMMGYWIFMKKAFTPKMIFRTDTDVCDSYWCKKVPEEKRIEIEQFFCNHPVERETFDKTNYIDHPAVSTMWLNMGRDEEKLILEIINKLPSLFTQAYFMNMVKEKGLSKCFSNPPGNYMISCHHSLWELDDEFNPLYKTPVLVRLTDDGDKVICGEVSVTGDDFD